MHTNVTEYGSTRNYSQTPVDICLINFFTDWAGVLMMNDSKRIETVAFIT